MTDGEGQQSEAFGVILFFPFALGFNILKGLVICHHRILTIIIVSALHPPLFFTRPVATLAWKLLFIDLS
jgi:hypothetical protein